MKTIEERLERLEKIVTTLCEVAVDTDNSWGAWADPLHAFIKEMRVDQHEDNEHAKRELKAAMKRMEEYALSRKK